jgi:hypothetical protein
MYAFPLVPQTRSLRGVFPAEEGRFHQCIGEVPEPGQNQVLTSCTKPHKAEALPTPVQMDVTKYPSAALLAKKGQSGCDAVANDLNVAKGVVITPSWTPRSYRRYWSGGTLYGLCWIHRQRGLLPPIK